MKRLLTFLALTCAAATSFAATLNPVQLLNPAGSTAGQTIVSTGASAAPGWAAVPLSGLSSMAANTVVANATGSTAAPTAFVMPSCLGSGTALNWNPGSGFVCNTTLNAATLNGTSSFPGRLLNVQVFSASGTYTPTAGTASIIVTVQAAGGGSGGIAATSTGQSSVSQAASSGSYAQVRYTSGIASQTITVGAGGIAGTAGANAGGTGGTSSFGALISCPGGIAGAGGAASSSASIITTAGAPSACTISGGTTILSATGKGSSSMSIILTAGSSQMAAGGAASLLGLGGRPLPNAAGDSGVGYGSSGSGVASGASASAAAGVAGQGGVVIVQEFSN